MKKIILKYFCYDPGHSQTYYKQGPDLYCFQNRGTEGLFFLSCSNDGEPSHPIKFDAIEKISEVPPADFLKELKKTDIKKLKSLAKSAQSQSQRKAKAAQTAAKTCNKVVLSVVSAINKNYIVRERNGKAKLIKRYNIKAAQPATEI